MYLIIGFILGLFIVTWLFIFNKSDMKDFIKETLLILVLTTFLWGLVVLVIILFCISKIKSLFIKEYLILLVPIFLLSTCVTIKSQNFQNNQPVSCERPAFVDKKYNTLKEKFKWINPEIYKVIKKESLKNNINENLIIALIDVESSGNPNATGKSGDIGLMQVIAKFHYKGNPYDLYVPEKNVETGSKYLAYCLAKSGQNKTLACIYYNAGVKTNVKNYKRWWYINRILSNIKKIEDK